ncbi:hypothetical protein [Burkholderia sp. Ac-20365]|uniref:hypothetical protein n=1 Tax=Burkholderia sp. Ac-20365 TaxID=2703897 RepID=UPI00197BB97E|nr:hypothetical protein [Burkholderia sp. Ac-20365]MBN3762027.1 hypothetical protein [Burkholderia sp. Ac-20365]
MKQTLREVGLLVVLGCTGLLAAPILGWVLLLIASGEGSGLNLPQAGTLYVTLAVIFVGSAVVFRAILFLRTRLLAARPPSHFGRISGNKQIESIVYALRQRATRLRRASNVILGLVVLSVLLGFRVFASAGYITSRDQTAAIDRISERALIGLERAVEDLQASKNVSQDDINGVRRLLADLETANKERAAAIREAGAGYAMTTVWSTISTRVASVLLLLFLVQILVTMYRYSIRLAAFYDARADILQLSPPFDSVQFAEIVSALSPDGLDFGREPKSPAQYAIDLAKEVIKGSRPSTESAKEG